jgi:Carbohydrate-selective porin, OprB family/S-layer homology domain
MNLINISPFLGIISNLSLLVLLGVSNTAWAETSSYIAPSIVYQIANVNIQEKKALIDEQVTSVNQLEDVQPTDWAFSALQSLIERYGVIAGYPNSRYQGNRAMTRYEFAAALNTTLERVNELIAQGATLLVSHDDLATLQRLQEEFTTELTMLKCRVDSLEASTASLEANQFSTTTKLTGQVIFALTGGGFSGERILDVTGKEIATENPNTTFIYRAALDFDTSFSSTDLLKIRLDIGSNGADDNAAGFLEPAFGSTLDFSAKPPVENLGLSRLYYTFSPFKDITLSLGPKIALTDYIDLNTYANLSFLDFSTQALVNNYILFPVQGLGAGGVISWKPGQGSFTVRAGYIASSANEPRETTSSVPGIFPLGYTLYPDGGSDQGLFGAPYQSIFELELAPSRYAALRLQYTSGNVLGGQFNVFGANAELSITNQFAIFGRYGFGSYNDTAFGDIEPSYWMAGVAFRDMFKLGALAGIAIGQPFIENKVGSATQTNFEAFYNLPVTANIRLTPLVQVITNPANQEENGTIFTGTLRTVFSF